MKRPTATRDPLQSAGVTRRTLLRGLGWGAAAALASNARSAARQPAPTGVPSVSCQDGSKKLVWLVRNDPTENPWEGDVARPAFMQQHPDICLDILSVEQDDIAVKRQAMLAARDALHVWSSAWGGNGLPTDVAEGVLQDLTPFIEQSGYDLSVFQPQTLPPFQVNGKQYGLPLLSTGSYLFYNKKIFDAAGVPYPPSDWDDESWTWERMIETAKALTTNYDDPNSAQYGLVAENAERIEFPPLIWGHDIFPESAYETGFADTVTITDERSTAAFQAFHDTIYKDKVSPDPAVSDALEQLGGTFVSGRVAMEIQGGWYLWTLKGLMDDPNGFCWGVAPIPYGAPDAEIRAITFTDPWVMTSGMDQENQDLAWTLIEFLTSEEQARAFMETTGTPPTQTKLYDEYFSLYSKCMQPDELKATFEGAFSHGIPESGAKLVGWDQLKQVWDNIVESYLADPGANTADMLKNLEEQTAAKLQQIAERYKA